MYNVGWTYMNLWTQFRTHTHTYDYVQYIDVHKYIWYNDICVYLHRTTSAHQGKFMFRGSWQLLSSRLKNSLSSSLIAESKHVVTASANKYYIYIYINIQYICVCAVLTCYANRTDITILMLHSFGWFVAIPISRFFGENHLSKNQSSEQIYTLED